MTDLSQLDVPTLLAQAGLSGALISGITTMVKAVTGWKGRRAILATLLIGVVIVTFKEAAQYWSLISHLWDGFIEWLMATGVANSGYQAWEKVSGKVGLSDSPVPNPLADDLAQAEADRSARLRPIQPKDVAGS